MYDAPVASASEQGIRTAVATEVEKINMRRYTLGSNTSHLEVGSRGMRGILGTLGPAALGTRSCATLARGVEMFLCCFLKSYMIATLVPK